MSELNPIGTLSFLSSVVTPETEWRGEKCKWVALARFHGVRRSECEALKEKFFEANPGITHHNLVAEWSCREII